MTEKLKPCPFCGSRKVLLHTQDVDWHFVECDKCHCSTPMILGFELGAIVAWNTRDTFLKRISKEGEIMAEKLKHCPFCGGEAEVRTYRDDIHFAQCKQCMSMTIHFQKPEGAIEAWNKRYTLLSRLKQAMKRRLEEWLKN